MTGKGNLLRDTVLLRSMPDVAWGQHTRVLRCGGVTYRWQWSWPQDINLPRIRRDIGTTENVAVPALTYNVMTTTRDRGSKTRVRQTGTDNGKQKRWRRS